MILKDRNKKIELKKYLKNNYLTLPLPLQMKIFLYKMSVLYSNLKQKIFYSPEYNMSNGLFGQSQLFSLGSDIYFYSPTPFQYTFRKVVGIYEINNYTFMILQNQAGYYQLTKDNFTISAIFLSFVDAKNYMEINYK